LLHNPPPGEGRGEGVQEQGWTPTRGLIVAKEKIAANGDYNLSGERYRENGARTNTFPLVPLGDMCTINPPKSEGLSLPSDTLVSFVPMSDLGENRMTFTPNETKRIDELGTSYTYFADGDVLVAKVTPCFENGKAGIARNLTNGVGFGSSEFYVLRPSDRVLAEFIYFCVTHRQFRDPAIEQMTGTGGLQRVPKGYVETFEIPLPPLEVQKEIVAEIEGYQRVIDGARAVLDHYRPHIPIQPDWPMVELGEICDPEYGYTASAADEGDARFIRITDISDEGALRANDAKYVALNDEARQSLLSKGDLLVARTGATFGKTMIFEEEYPAVFASFLIRLRFPADKVVPRYYWAFAQSDAYWSQANALVTGGGQPQFNGNAIKRVRIPLPPLPVQRSIVSEVEAERRLVEGNRELIARMETKIAATLARIWGESDTVKDGPSPAEG